MRTAEQLRRYLVADNMWTDAEVDAFLAIVGTEPRSEDAWYDLVADYNRSSAVPETDGSVVGSRRDRAAERGTSVEDEHRDAAHSDHCDEAERNPVRRSEDNRADKTDERHCIEDEHNLPPRLHTSPPVHDSSMTVTPRMREAVVDVVNDQLAEHVDTDYQLSAATDGAHLWMTDGGERTLLWVYAHDNVSGFHWSGWVTADGRACDTLSEVEEEMAR